MHLTLSLSIPLLPPLSRLVPLAYLAAALVFFSARRSDVMRSLDHCDEKETRGFCYTVGSVALYCNIAERGREVNRAGTILIATGRGSPHSMSENA